MEWRAPSLLFRRYEGNPILTPADWPYPVNAVFNPGAIEHEGETLLLVRVEDLRGFSHLTLARSRDGRTNWRIEPRPTLEPDPRYKEECWGIEDPRIIWLADQEQYAITYVSFSRGGPLISLALTRDFRQFERIGPLLPPEDKDASLFPRRIRDRYVLLHRPIIRGEAHIWISTSPDLRYWGEHQIVIPARPGWWDSHRVGLGPPPIETSEGWLIIYHGVRVTASGSLYRVGLALLDLDYPWRLVRRTENWVFAPQESYERHGDVPGVVFPTGAIVERETGQLRLYYGAADTTVCLALAPLDEVLDYLKRCPAEASSEAPC
ncbi:MAG: glycosidase [Blastocatellia bacterium]|nr:glycosidase [Blastocatellia bacterium]MCS7156863.1 glycosidase [Blastocatellia bacterium]MCX7752821.1 glycosidase [Blastocatellia bacterium]MDW8167555.1 glycosidase [Acidobacteriota bacterium]MDW8256155.1 glycosidase [Acidobacteriota bacterium]